MGRLSWKKIEHAGRPNEIANTAGRGFVSGLTLGASDAFKVWPGQKNDAIFGGANKVSNAEAGRKEAQHQAEVTANRDSLLASTDANFGVGLSPEAQSNASRLGGRRAAAINDAFNTGRGAAENSYANDLSDVRANLARAGLNGSGMEGQAKSDLLSRYFGQIAGAIANSQQTGVNFDNAATTGRLGIRQNVQGGQITDTTGLASGIAGLQAQGSPTNIWGNSIGQFAQSAANQYANNRLSNAYGQNGQG